MLCPDLRGLGWSGPPADDDFRKQRMADDAIALLDALGLEQVRLAGHDWGAYAAILAAVTAPERFSSLLAMSVGHPWVPTKVAARNGYLLAYQLPLATPFVGERVVRDGRYVRGMLRNGRRDGRRWTREEEDAYVDVVRRDRARVLEALPRLPAPRRAHGRPAAPDDAGEAADRQPRALPRVRGRLPR